MRNSRHLLTAVCLLSFFTVAYQNCSKVNFQPDGSGQSVTGTSTGPTCTAGFAESLLPTKVLFVVDLSGSNRVLGKDSTGQQIPGTDPNKVWRSAVMNTFLTTFEKKSNLQYGLITFQGKAAQSLLPGSGFTADPVAMQAAIQTFQKMMDNDATPYLAALSKAKSLIAADPDLKAVENQKYLIVFLSDGTPADAAIAGSDVIDQTKINGTISDILALAPGQISLSTAYYYNGVSNDLAVASMSSMAMAGDGLFSNIVTGGEVNVDDTVQIPTQICQ